MVCEDFVRHHSPVHRIDPRVRVLAAIAFALLLAVCRQIPVATAGLLLALALAALARLPIRPLARRLGELNLFMLIVCLTLPFTTPGAKTFTLAGFAATAEGIAQALMITMKGNAIVLAVTALVSTIESVRLGQTLGALRVPQKLTHLFLFTVRYLDLLHHESARLARAGRARCFRPRLSAHTFRTIGYFVGMLLVESFERSERVLDAMKCRGFQGRFPLGDPFRLRPADTIAACAAAIAIAAIALMEYKL